MVYGDSFFGNLKIYRDGIIVKSSDSVVETNQLGSGKIFCSDFLRRAELRFSEGEVISDLVFNQKNALMAEKFPRDFGMIFRKAGRFYLGQS